MTDTQAVTIGLRLVAKPHEIEAAKEIFEDDDVKIPADGAKAVFADDAVWVSAWVRVPKAKFVRELT